MNNECGHGALARGLFEFVDPPAVVSERFALKKFRIVGNRLVHKKQRDFSVHIDAFVVVPIVFGRFDSESDKNDRRVYISHVSLRFIVDGEIVEELEADGASTVRALWHEAELRLG